jgi:membrane-bound inhibitor of C-type lysozyme
VTEVFSSEAGGSPLLQPFLLIKFTKEEKKKVELQTHTKRYRCKSQMFTLEAQNSDYMSLSFHTRIYYL